MNSRTINHSPSNDNLDFLSLSSISAGLANALTLSELQDLAHAMLRNQAKLYHPDSRPAPGFEDHYKNVVSILKGEKSNQQIIRDSVLAYKEVQDELSLTAETVTKEAIRFQWMQNDFFKNCIVQLIEQPVKKYEVTLVDQVKLVDETVRLTKLKKAEKKSKLLPYNNYGADPLKSLISARLTKSCSDILHLMHWKVSQTAEWCKALERTEVAAKINESFNARIDPDEDIRAFFSNLLALKGSEKELMLTKVFREWRRAYPLKWVEFANEIFRSGKYGHDLVCTDKRITAFDIKDPNLCYLFEYAVTWLLSNSPEDSRKIIRVWLEKYPEAQKYPKPLNQREQEKERIKLKFEAVVVENETEAPKLINSLGLKAPYESFNINLTSKNLDQCKLSSWIQHTDPLPYELEKAEAYQKKRSSNSSPKINLDQSLIEYAIEVARDGKVIFHSEHPHRFEGMRVFGYFFDDSFEHLYELHHLEKSSRASPYETKISYHIPNPPFSYVFASKEINVSEPIQLQELLRVIHKISLLPYAKKKTGVWYLLGQLKNGSIVVAGRVKEFSGLDNLYAVEEKDIDD